LVIRRLGSFSYLVALGAQMQVAERTT
jgi:hypothetical protein